MDDLLYALHSDGADALRLRVGQPPVIVLDGELQPLDGPPITAQLAESLFGTIAHSRLRRELRERGTVKFICRFRGRVSFVVQARVEDGGVAMDIH